MIFIKCKTNIIISLFIILIISISINAQTTIQNNPTEVSDSVKYRNSIGITQTQWIDPNGSSPTTFSQWKSNQGPDRQFEIQNVQTFLSNNKSGNGIGFCIIIGLFIS